MKKKIVFVLVLLSIVSCSIFAQSINGRWERNLPENRRLVLTFRQNIMTFETYSAGGRVENSMDLLISVRNNILTIPMMDSRFEFVLTQNRLVLYALNFNAINTRLEGTYSRVW